VRQDVHEVAGIHLDGPILEPQPSRSFQHDHPLVLVLVEPETFGRGVAVGNDSLDADVGGFEQRREKLVGQAGRKVGEEVSWRCHDLRLSYREQRRKDFVARAGCSRESTHMALQKVTEAILRSVEEATGRPVVVRPDPSLVTLLAKVTMARGSAPAHLVAYNPHAGAVDYAICVQCGFLLRMFNVPEVERFSLAGSSLGWKEIEGLIAEHLRQKRISFPTEIRSKLVEQFFGGIIQQLRSYPIGLRVDSWLRQSYPGFAEQQKKAIDRQLNDNAMTLRPEVRQIAPAKVFEANVGMNAAFALFWSRTCNDPLLTVPYKSSGNLATGEKLLKLWDEIPEEPANDKKLIDAWGSQAGLTGWYDFLPYE
jgi:hypothetical protein